MATQFDPLGFVGDLVNGAGGAVQDMVGAVASGAGEVAQGAINTVGQGVDAVGNAVGGVIEDVFRPEQKDEGGAGFLRPRSSRAMRLRSEAMSTSFFLGILLSVA